MEETKKREMELSFTEGENTEQVINEGEVRKDVQEQKVQQKDTELLQSINQKLDLLLAAQNIN